MKLQIYLAKPIEPGQESFLRWFDGLKNFGQETCVTAAVGMAELVLSIEDSDESTTNRSPR